LRTKPAASKRSATPSRTPQRHRRGQQALAEREARVARALDEQHVVSRAPQEVRERRPGGAPPITTASQRSRRARVMAPF
jgi:hypothetical protein